MEDIKKVIRTYSDTNVLLVTDFKIDIVATEILKTIELFQKYGYEKATSEEFTIQVKKMFILDIDNNHFHRILWENWINFMADIDLLEIGTRWGNNTHTLSVTDSDIIYLKNIIDFIYVKFIYKINYILYR